MTDSRGVHLDAPSGELRQRRSELGGQSAPRGDDRSSAEGEERFGARWNGFTNESLAAPPVRHHGPGVANADADLQSDAVEGARNTIASAGSPALLAEERASSGVRPNEPRSPRSANHCAARRGGAQPSAAVWRRSRGCFTTRAETRFVSSFAATRFRAPWRCSRG